MSAQRIDHVLITRFNVPTPGRESLIRAKDGWLRDRVDLFERFCAPSVEGQTNQDFHWLIYFDPESPGWLMEWLDANGASRRFTPVFRTSVSNAEMVDDLRRLTGARGDVLLTTNLDNDDGLAVDFVERLQAAVSGTARQAIYLTHGLILCDRRVYLRTDRHNAFCSVAETWDAPVTAWADWHNRLGLAMPVKEVAGPPAWLQVVHGRNVSNSVHGRLLSPSPLTHLFPSALPGLGEPTARQMFVGNVIAGPLRAVKAALRTALKGVLLRLLGPNGFDALKNRAAEILDRRQAPAGSDAGPAAPLNQATGVGQ